MMTVSDHELPRYQRTGRMIRINFDHRIIEREEDGAVRTEHHYTTAEFCLTCTREQRIEAVIATRYPTPGSEFAAIQNGGAERDAHQAFRTYAKELVDGLES